MAVKIISPEPDPRFVKRTSCSRCGSQLEYLPVDTHEYTSTDYTGGKDIHVYINCPKCGHSITVGIR